MHYTIALELKRSAIICFVGMIFYTFSFIGYFTIIFILTPFPYFLISSSDLLPPIDMKRGSVPSGRVDKILFLRLTSYSPI